MSIAFTVLFDSLCPVCRREVALLKWLDRGGALQAIDITQPEFEPSRFGLTLDQCIGSLYGIRANGERVTGMETVRAMYDAIGLGPLMSWTKVPFIRPAADLAYRTFARYRPRFSAFKPQDCANDRCKVDHG